MQYRCLIVCYCYGLNDPVVVHSATSFVKLGWNVRILQLPPDHVFESPTPDRVQATTVTIPGPLTKLGTISRLVRWNVFQRAVQTYIERDDPHVIVTIMLHGLAALPESWRRNHSERHVLVSCIFDIPSLGDAGHLDSIILAKGWKRLCEADLVWSSDPLKAELALQSGGLHVRPIVCHNTPPLGAFQKAIVPRDGALRRLLQEQGARIGNIDGCIIVRAGAIGQFGGIEETLSALLYLPPDYIFLMMGRPSNGYAIWLRRQIVEMGLQERAFLWERPSDELWHTALEGADVGHLLHGPFPDGASNRVHNLNSALSNHRLFGYMAAGLPILTYDDPRLGPFFERVPCSRIARHGHLESDIQKHLFELGSHPQTRAELGRIARSAYMREFHWETQFAPVAEAVSALLLGHSSDSEGKDIVLEEA